MIVEEDNSYLLSLRAAAISRAARAHNDFEQVVQQRHDQVLARRNQRIAELGKQFDDISGKLDELGKQLNETDGG